MDSTIEDTQQVLHWRDSSWHRIESWNNWARFTGWEKPWAPLSHVGRGEHYFVVCAMNGDRLFNILPHRYLIDDDGRIAPDDYFGVLSNHEIERYQALNKRHYGYPQSHPLSEQEQREFNAIRDRLWRSWLPSAAAVRELMRVLPAMPNDGDAAWNVLGASGLFQSFGRA